MIALDIESLVVVQVPGRQKYRVKWFRLLVILVAGYFCYVFVGQQASLNAVNRENQAAREHLEELKQLNQSLKQEKDLLNNPVYVEKIAREELGLVKPGETPYIPARKN